MAITDYKIFIELAHARLNLGKITDKDLDFNKMTNEDAIKLTKDINKLVENVYPYLKNYIKN